MTPGYLRYCARMRRRAVRVLWVFGVTIGLLTWRAEHRAYEIELRLRELERKPLVHAVVYTSPKQTPQQAVRAVLPPLLGVDEVRQ